MMRLGWMLAVAVMLGWMSSTAAAGEEVVVVFEAYPPYEYMKDGKAAGQDVELVQKAFDAMGVKVKFEDVPWKRAMDQVKKGEVHAIMSLFKTDEREGFLLFPPPISKEKNIILTKKGSDIKVAGLANLKGKKVGVVAEYSYGEKFDKAELDKEASKDNATLLKKLNAGRIDCAVMNELVYKLTAKEQGLEGKFAEEDYVVADEAMYLAFSKANKAGADLVEKFAEALKKVQ